MVGVAATEFGAFLLAMALSRPPCSMLSLLLLLLLLLLLSVLSMSTWSAPSIILSAFLLSSLSSPAFVTVGDLLVSVAFEVTAPACRAQERVDLAGGALLWPVAAGVSLEAVVII